MKRAVSAAAMALMVGLLVYTLGTLVWHGDVPSPASIALAASSCDCPEKQCANGKVAGCAVTCPNGHDAVCACDGFCDDNGNAGGLNRCLCQ